VTDMRLPILYCLDVSGTGPSAMHFPVMDLRHLEFLTPGLRRFVARPDRNFSISGGRKLEVS